MTFRRASLVGGLLALLLAAPGASAAPGDASLVALGGPDTTARVAAFARETAEGIRGRLLLAARPLPHEEIAFTYASGRCGQPAGETVEVARGKPTLAMAAMNMPFAVAKVGLGVAGLRSLRVSAGDTQLMCARTQPLRAAGARERPDVLVAELRSRHEDGPNGLLVARPGIRRLAYNAILSPRDAASGLPTARAATFEEITWTLTAPRLDASCVVFNSTDWDFARMIFGSGAGKCSRRISSAVTRVTLRGDRTTLATGTFRRYVTGLG